MVATVRLDQDLEAILSRLSKMLHKKKSDVIREAIHFYAQNRESDKKTKILKAVEKTKYADKSEYKNLEGTLNDGM